jgi:hypothetical protein
VARGSEGAEGSATDAQRRRPGCAAHGRSAQRPPALPAVPRRAISRPRPPLPLPPTAPRSPLQGDFVLVSADTVSNMRLAPLLEAHRSRRAADKNAIMTLVG